MKLVTGLAEDVIYGKGKAKKNYAMVILGMRDVFHSLYGSS